MTAHQETARTFIATAISTEAHRVLGEAVGCLRQDIPQGVGWVRPEGIHLTLKFLGNIRLEMVDRVLDSLAASAAMSEPFQLGLSGRLGVFPNSWRPRVLWAGIDGDLAALSALQEAVEEAMENLGFSPEERPYSPHLTLGRVRRGVSDAALAKMYNSVTAVQLPGAQPWQVDSFHLFKTDLKPSGSVHTVLGSVTLDAPDTPPGRP